MNDLRRIVWQHTSSGIIDIGGVGLASTVAEYSQDDVVWLNKQFKPLLCFTLQEWNGVDWVEVDDE